MGLHSKPRAPYGIRGKLLRFWYGCSRKIPYKTQEEAAAMAAHFGEHVGAYKCQYLNHWHIGRKPGTPRHLYYSG